MSRRTRRNPLAVGLAALLTLWGCGVARAQFFTIAENPYERYRRLGVANPDHVERLQLGAYLAQWDFPSFPSGGISVRTDTRASALLTLDYFATPSLSLGGFWNRIPGSLHQSERTDLPGRIADFEGDFWDVHATYYFPDRTVRGWSVQVGYSTFHLDVDLAPALRNAGAQNFAVTTHSPSIWIANSQVGAARDPKGGRRTGVFGSLGYYTSSEFDKAWNVIVGGSWSFSPHLGLSGSVWINNLDDPEIRTSVGLTARF